MLHNWNVLFLWNLPDWAKRCRGGLEAI